jgi:hypothetical protein
MFRPFTTTSRRLQTIKCRSVSLLDCMTQWIHCYIVVFSCKRFLHGTSRYVTPLCRQPYGRNVFVCLNFPPQYEYRKYDENKIQQLSYDDVKVYVTD